MLLKSSVKFGHFNFSLSLLFAYSLHGIMEIVQNSYSTYATMSSISQEHTMQLWHMPAISMENISPEQRIPTCNIFWNTSLNLPPQVLQQHKQHFCEKCRTK